MARLLHLKGLCVYNVTDHSGFIHVSTTTCASSFSPPLWPKTWTSAKLLVLQCFSLFQDLEDTTQNVGRGSDDVSSLSLRATGNGDLDQFEWTLARQLQSWMQILMNRTSKEASVTTKFWGFSLESALKECVIMDDRNLLGNEDVSELPGRSDLSSFPLFWFCPSPREQTPPRLKLDQFQQRWNEMIRFPVDSKAHGHAAVVSLIGTIFCPVSGSPTGWKRLPGDRHGLATDLNSNTGRDVSDLCLTPSGVKTTRPAPLINVMFSLLRAAALCLFLCPAQVRLLNGRIHYRERVGLIDWNIISIQ